MIWGTILRYHVSSRLYPMRLFLQKVTAGKADYFGIIFYVEEPIDKSLICLACFGRGTSATARLGIDWNNFSRVISGSF